MSGDVAHLACRRPHPQRGDAVRCERQRWHAGDHRSEQDGQLRVWPDPAARPPSYDPPTVLHDPVPGDLDEQTETWQLDGTPRWLLWFYGYVGGLVVVGLPPAVVLAWREVFK